MIKYKNISTQVLTFYGVTFNPNDIKEVPGFINHVKMVRILETSPIPTPKAIITSPKQQAPEVVEKKVQSAPKRKHTKRNTISQ